MARRTRYKNGDPVSLPGGCDGCAVARINGVLSHEIGCPEAWRDYKVECFECEREFYLHDRPIGAARTGSRRIHYCHNCAKHLR